MGTTAVEDSGTAVEEEDPGTTTRKSEKCQEACGGAGEEVDVSHVFQLNFVFDYCHAGLKERNLVCPR